MIVEDNVGVNEAPTKFETEVHILVMRHLNAMSWPEVCSVMKAGGDQKEALVVRCSVDVDAGLEEWLKKGKNRKYADDVDELFGDPDNTQVFMETEIDHAYTVICARKESKYEKAARKRAEARALKRQEELASRDSADAPAAGAPEGPAAGAPEHKAPWKAPWKAPRKALRQGAPRALPEAGAKKRKRVVSDDEEAPSPANAAGALEPPEDPEAAAKREAKRAKSIRDAASKERRTKLARLFNPVVREVAITLKQDTNVVDGVTPRELHNKASLYVFGDEELENTYQEWLSKRFKTCTLDYVTNAWLDTKFPLPKPAPAAAGPLTSRDVAMAERPATQATTVTPGRASARSIPVPRSSPGPPDSPDTPPPVIDYSSLDYCP